MTRYFLLAGAVFLSTSTIAAADPGKHKNGKSFEHAKKSEKLGAKQHEHAFKARNKLSEKHFEGRNKLVKREDKAFEKQFERRDKLVETAAKRERKSWERGYKSDWTEAYQRRERQLGLAQVGQRLDLSTAGYVPSWYRGRYADSSNYYYRYDDSGYLYQVNRGNNLVSALLPLLGGAYSAGRMLPVSYADPVPLAYRDIYRDNDDHYYRYGDRGIYQVNAQTGIIQNVVALLTGNTLGVGNSLPVGYDAYNVPDQYRGQYFDTADSWYRYNDGQIYQVDPTTRLIQAVISAVG